MSDIDPTGASPNADAAISSGAPQPTTHTPPGADSAPPPDISQYEKQIERLKQQVSGSQKVIGRLKEYGIEDPNDPDALERTFGHVRKFRERGLDPSRISSIFDQDQPNQPDPHADFDIEDIKRQATQDALATLRQEIAYGDHNKAHNAAMDTIEKGVAEILGEGATAAEKKLWTKAAKQEFWDMTVNDPYPEDHPLGRMGYGKPVSPEKVMEALRSIQSEIAAEKAASVGDNANARRKPVTPAGQTAQTKSSGEPDRDRTMPSRSERAAKLQERINKIEGRPSPVSQAR